jgi:AcrR family transcriptional regulator
VNVSQPASADRPVATRRRGAALETALLDAAWAELQEVGDAGLTMEAVADRASTSRAVIYRRWPSRHKLIIAALAHQQPIGRGRIPDTGSLREDVLRIMQRAARRISDIGPSTVTGLLSDLIADDALHEIIDQLARGRSAAGGRAPRL